MTEPYFYLAGPMSGIPQNNFPAFDREARELRWMFNIVSPAELDDPVDREAALASPGVVDYNDEYRRFLRRDVNIVMDENCLGLFVLEGWEHSKGALLETYVAEAFGKPIYKAETGELIDRAAALAEAEGVA